MLFLAQTPVMQGARTAVRGCLGSQAGRQSTLEHYVEVRLPSHGAMGAAQRGSKHSFIYNHANTWKMTSAMSAVDRWDNALPECVAEGPVEHRRMAESTNPVRPQCQSPAHMSSVDLDLSFLEWHLWDNSDNTSADTS